jgi:predicted N-formylglutamate amidohydrolase
MHARTPAPATLLGPDDPPPVERVAGAPGADAVFVCDHAGRRVPRALGDLGLPRPEFDRHIAWDIGAADVARRLAAVFAAPLLLSTYSRLVADCNRPPGAPGFAPETADGTPVPANRGLSAAARARRASELHAPYHAAIAAELAAMRARGFVPAVVSVHSFTPVFAGAARPWHVGVLWNGERSVPARLIAALAARGDLCVGDNRPYDARDGHGFTMAEHCERARLPHALLEIRQDLIDTPAGAARWATILAAALGPILADPALRRPGDGG